MRANTLRFTPNWPLLFRSLLAGISFYVIAVGSIAISRDASDIALLWLANIATVGFIFRQPALTQIAVLVCCFVAGLIANVTTGASWQSALIFMTANSVEIVCASLILREFERRWPTDNAVNLMKAIATVAAIPPVVGATIAVTLLRTIGAADGWGLWTSWWIADAAGTVTLLPMILLSRDCDLSPIRFRQAMFHFAWVSAVVATTVLVVSYLTHPFVYVGLVMMLVAMLSNPFWTAACAAFVVTTISICVFEGIFGIFRSSGSAIDNALHLHASVAVLPAICLSLVLQHLRFEKARVLEVADQFRRVMEDSAIGMALVSGRGRILKANKAMAEMFGYPIAPLETLTVADITGPEDQNISRETLSRIAAGTLDRFRFEKRYKRRDGTIFWAQLAGSVIRSASDDSYYTISQIEDIDASKHHQIALQAMEERWRFAFIAAKQGVWDANLETGTTYYSPIWCSLIGYDPSEVGNRGNRWLDFLHPEDRERIMQLDADQILGRSETFEAQFRMRHKDGRWIWILDRGQVVERNGDGIALRMLGTHTDITQQKELEQEMLLLSERIKLSVEAGGVGTWHWNPQTQDVWWDERMFGLYGVEPTDFRGTFKDWSERVHPEDLPKILPLLEPVISGTAALDTEFRVVTPNGDVRHIRGLARMSRSAGDSQVLVGTNWDITEQKRLLVELTEANQKLKEFASFASHDLQAPLRHIRTQGELIRIALQDRLAPEITRPLDIITSKSKHLQDMIRNLLTFAKAAEEISFQAVSLEKVVSDSVEEVVADLRECGGRIDYDALPDVAGDEVLLRQVFQNLLMNSIKYRGEHAPLIKIDAELHAQKAIIRIADNGIGIAPKHEGYIFDAFKRIPNRAAVQGSGLGLALCRRIVEGHGGEIWLESSGPTGSTFKMSLPISLQA